MPYVGGLELNGTITGSLGGVAKQTLNGKLALSNNQVKGELSIGADSSLILKPYQGPYIIVPKAHETQTLETNRTRLTDNIVVMEIPYSQVMNEYDGITVTIGE